MIAEGLRTATNQVSITPDEIRKRMQNAIAARDERISARKRSAEIAEEANRAYGVGA